MVHDVVCSWCPIGYSHIQKALRNLKVEADFHFLPYEINPDMSAGGEAIDAYFERRNQWGNSRLLDYQKNLLAVAESADVAIDFSRRTHYYNSGKAHRLMHWAEGHNHQQLALSSIPAFIINESTLVSGSNSVDYFEQVIATLHEPNSESLVI